MLQHAEDFRVYPSAATQPKRALSPPECAALLLLLIFERSQSPRLGDHMGGSPAALPLTQHEN
jgi:hypothetical protein